MSKLNIATPDIRIVTSAGLDDQAAWDEYVDAHQDGSFCHLFGWRKAIEQALGLTPHYLKITDSSLNIVGILPLFEVKSWLFGHTLVSTPFCMYGGALADDPSAHQALIEEAKALAHRLQVDYLELRYQQAQPQLESQAFMLKSVHSYFVSPIADSDDEILLAIKKKQRAVVRHSLKNNLQSRVDQDIDTLYHIYSTSVRNLGTPVFSKKLFKALLREFPEHSDILTIEHDGQAISSVMSFYYKDMVMPYYGGGLASARQLKANDHMYYQLMRHARQKMCKYFDFGRSKNDSGAYKYKASWGIEAKALFHYYHLVNASELPDLSPNNPKFQRKIALWQKLPLRVSQCLGPFVSKYLG